jgi:hypothetical protein
VRRERISRSDEMCLDRRLMFGRRQGADAPFVRGRSRRVYAGWALASIPGNTQFARSTA